MTFRLSNTCLVVEDEPLLALDIETMLAGCGYAIAGPFASWSEALELVERDPPAAAIVDFQVQDGSSVVLLRALEDAGIPFLIYSGRERESSPDFADALWLEKPCMPDKLEAAVRSLFRHHQRTAAASREGASAVSA